MSLHVDVVGNGPPLVLLHGWAMHGGVFAPLVARLRDRFTLHVVDLPGHGLSRDCGVALTLDNVVDALAPHVPVAWKNRIVAMMPAPSATPAASHTWFVGGKPCCCSATAATRNHAGWLASVMPNTRCVALRCSPVLSRCSSNMRLPIGYSTADNNTHASASHAARSSAPCA